MSKTLRSRRETHKRRYRDVHTADRKKAHLVRETYKTEQSTQVSDKM